ncbi:MAG TPA: hypothetical protein VNT26_08785, partial [Candidatus Sulfotelmatobacter sp.]|nr:hypothetical protein [Candidatus Sulfotelmatobacter sp.]
TDLDRRPRIVSAKVDVGAYEFQGPDFGEFLAWLQQYGLAADGSADGLDADADGLNNWQEWRARTDPTNASSVLMLQTAALAGANPTVSWQGLAGVTYYLQRATHLAAQPAFSSIQSNLVGQGSIISYTDTNAVGRGPFFYRLGVQ